MTRRVQRLVWLLLAMAPAALAADKPKVVVIGFDGADPKLVERYMAEGLLPHLEQLSHDGKFSPLMPTNPPQTPVSWSAFATGLNPGRTEVFDFLKRDPKTYIPDFALASPSKKQLGFGERNGLVAAATVGGLAALLTLLVVGLASKRWGIALVAALLVGGGSTAGLTGPLRRALPVEVPDAINARQGTPFWTTAAQAGHRVQVTHVPVTFPAEALPDGSTMLSGLGVPDMRGRVGTPTIWSSDPKYSVGDNQFSVELIHLPARRGPIETNVIGPFNYPFHQYVLERARVKWKADKLSAAERAAEEKALKQKLKEAGTPERFDLKLQLEVADDHLEWRLGAQRGTLRVGEWSDWVILDFPVNWLVDRLQPLRGMSRFRLNRLDEEVELYLAPVNFHPACHPVAYSWPPDWAEQLSDQVGLFKTIGWSIDTWSYPTGFGGIDLFVDDMWHTVERQSKILDEQLGKQRSDLYVQIFDFTDRAGHMLWHEMDEQHPLYDPAKAQKYQQVMKAVYVKMDQLVGRARELAGPDALFIVVSDHGFSSFRRQINYNTWLYKHGYLALSGQVGPRDLQQLFDADVSGVNVLSGIDWSRTKAWALGLGAIYINVVGRERGGIVMPGAEYDQLVQEIKQGLENEVDPVTGLKPVARIYRRDELYRGYDAEKIPDLRAANIENYRISWQDTLGGLSTTIFEDNDRTWSGDHCSLEPALVRGILFVNRKLTVPDPGIIDIAPSILGELGLKPDKELDGRVIWQKR